MISTQAVAHADAAVGKGAVLHAHAAAALGLEAEAPAAREARPARGGGSRRDDDARSDVGRRENRMGVCRAPEQSGGVPHGLRRRRVSRVDGDERGGGGRHESVRDT